MRVAPRNTKITILNKHESIFGPVATEASNDKIFLILMLTQPFGVSIRPFGIRPHSILDPPADPTTIALR